MFGKSYFLLSGRFGCNHASYKEKARNLFCVLHGMFKGCWNDVFVNRWYVAYSGLWLFMRFVLVPRKVPCSLIAKLRVLFSPMCRACLPDRFIAHLFYLWLCNPQPMEGHWQTACGVCPRRVMPLQYILLLQRPCVEVCLGQRLGMLVMVRCLTSLVLICSRD